MSTRYDLIIIGGGPGGYVCAIRAAQLGMKVAVVEKRPALGGTCLNVGCIPSKALLSASHQYHNVLHKFPVMGINVAKPSVDLKKMMAFKQDVINSNVQGIDFLFKKNGIDKITGAGMIVEPGKVQVNGRDKTTLSGHNIVIASGSQSIDLPGITVDEKRILTSTGALELSEIPAQMVVIGGGYIGLEMAAVWQRFGTKVTVVEFLDRILPGMDRDVSKEMQKVLEKEGMTFRLGTKVTSAQADKKGVSLTLAPAAGGGEEKLQSDYLLVAVGRKAYTEGLGLDKIGVKLDERGRISVDETFETSVEGIFAIGDVIAGPMLAHKAEEEGVVLAEMLAGQSGHIDYDHIPGVVYTAPEAAAIGKTEEQLKEAGVTYNVGKFPFMANGRARSMAETDGFVKILADKKTDRVLGAHIIGPEAGALIHEIAVLMSFGGSSEDLARTCHAHPTLNEAVKEAAMAAHGKPIHM